MRYRRLLDSARSLSTEAKNLEREIEKVNRKTQNMGSKLVRFASEQLPGKIRDSVLHIKTLASLADKITTAGYKKRFDLHCLHTQRARKLLRFSTAKAIYASTKELSDPKLTVQGSSRGKLGDTRLSTSLLDTWKHEWRQLLLDEDNQTGNRSRGKSLLKSLSNKRENLSNAALF